MKFGLDSETIEKINSVFIQHSEVEEVNVKFHNVVDDILPRTGFSLKA